MHDFKPPRKRPCKQAENPNDLCPHFNPNRGKCALMYDSTSVLLNDNTSALMYSSTARLRLPA